MYILLKIICWIAGHQYQIIGKNIGIASERICLTCGDHIIPVVWPDPPEGE